MEKWSTGICNMLLGGVAGEGSLKDIVDGFFKLMVYGGPPPLTADAALGSQGTNVLLVTLANAGNEVTLDAAAAAGVIAKNPAETWSGTNVATGTGTFYRFQKTADAGLLSTVAPRIQGTVGVGDTDGVVASVAFVNGEPFSVGSFTQSILPT